MSQPNQLKLDALLHFKKRGKFSLSSWNERGLNPSNDETNDFLNNFFNSCATHLMDAVSNDASKKQLRAILNSNLSSLNTMDYDSEEREFICDLFKELSENIKIDFNNNLNKWLYGSSLNAFFKIQNIFKSTKIIDTLTQPCDSCGIKLESYVIKKEQGIPETDWLIVKCNNCGKFNLLSVGPGVKELKFGNYQWIENVRIEEFTYEQAIERINQIK